MDDGYESPEFDLPFIESISDEEPSQRPSKRVKGHNRVDDGLEAQEELALRMLRGT